jgi:hypothetical protein
MTNIIAFPQTSLAGITASFTIAAGSPILAAPPRQPFQEAESLLAQAAASAKEFDNVLASAARALGIQALHIAPKAEKRFREKAQRGQRRQCGYNLRPFAWGLIATSAQQIRKALDFFCDGQELQSC